MFCEFKGHISLPKGTLIGTFFKTEEQFIRRVKAEPVAENYDHIQEMCEKAVKSMEKENTTLTQQQAFQNLIKEYAQVFAKNDFDLGQFNALEHKIDTGDAPPQVTKMRRCPLHFVDEEKRHLDKMFEADVIQPSSSAWSSQPVLI